MRILIADDSVVSRHLLEATLTRWGYEVVVASDGTEAWNIFQSENPPRLAILDWMMPGMTGPEVCRRVRVTAKDKDVYTYIVLLSSKGERDDLIEGMEAGADNYLTKPFDQHEMKVRLRPGVRIIELQQELISAREELREQATKDFLTRTWNRLSILEIFDRELSRGVRENRSVGVVLADLDHFKSINDTYGHFAGDAVLREFVRRVGGCIRPYDAVGRYGGEEFLIILPGCDEAATRKEAERMRSVLADVPMAFNEESRIVTCSFGATTSIPAEASTTEWLIRVADDALYRAKRGGRNQVAFVTSSAGSTASNAPSAEGIERKKPAAPVK